MNFTENIKSITVIYKVYYEVMATTLDYKVDSKKKTLDYKSRHFINKK